MPPVQVKIYGLLTLTRRAYLTLKIIEVLWILAAIGVGLWWPRPPLPAGVEPSPGRQLVVGLLDMLPWLGLLFLVIEVGETYLVLRQFARKQAEADRAALLARSANP